MSTEVVNKRFKKKLKSGIIYFGIAIALILIGIVLWITGQGTPLMVVAIVLLFIAAIPFLNGVGLLVVSAVIKVRMENLEKRYKGVLISGCFILGIGIVLVFVAGLRFAMTMTAFYLFMFSLAFFCVGGVLLFASRELKKRMGDVKES